MSLNLQPNEIVGYRIKPDWHSYNVVLVKKHGPASKNANQEYETPLAYCKNLEFAANWIFSHATRVQAELNQKDAEAVSGSVADVEALRAAFEVARAQTLSALQSLQTRIDQLGLSQKDLVKALGTAEPDPV